MLRSCCLLLVILLGLAVGACGGGGGGGGNPSSSSNGTFSAVFAPSDTIDVTTIEGHPQQATQSATLTYTGQSKLYLVAGYNPAIVSSITNGSVVGAQLTGTINFRSDLAVGNYSTKIYLHACLDAQCASEVSGSPAVQTINLTVLPNISVTTSVTLQRTGVEPAPTATVPVTVPVAAGTVTLTMTDPTNVISATFDGTNLQVATTQARAGTYAAQLILQGSADSRYTQTVSVTYTVSAPPGGETPLTLLPSFNSLILPQGGTAMQNIQVSRPTWTSAWDTPVSYDTTGMLSITDLGNNQYQVTVNAAGQAVGSYSADIKFSAGPTGGQAFFYLTWWVGSPFWYSVTTPSLNLVLDATTTPTALQFSGPVVTASGQAATWHATNSSPWLSLSPATGTTGIDPLTVTVDPAFGGLDDWSYVGNFSLTTSLPGTTAQSTQFSVTNFLPEVQRTVAVLSGTGGRVYVDGAITNIFSHLLDTNSLSVTGATLSAASYRNDLRLAAPEATELAFDLTGAIPGTPIQIAVNTPLTSSQVSIAVKAPAQVASGYAALPFGAYRPSSYAPGLDAFYFSSNSNAYRWAESAGAWTLGQTAISGLIGTALRQDEQALYASAMGKFVRLDPVTLATVSQSGPLQTMGIFSFNVDNAGPPSLSTLQFASDGRAIASLALLASGLRNTVGAGWISGTATSRKLPDLTDTPILAEPGWPTSIDYQNVQTGVGLVASPTHHAIAATAPSGTVAVYQSSQANWRAGPVIPAGLSVVAIDDAASTFVRSDGIVQSASAQLGDLNVVVPLNYVAAGYGLTQDGRHGLVYGYQPDATSGAQPATNGVVWLVDLSQIATTPLSATNLMATLPLASPVGCTSATLAAGETCAHTASITVAPGSASAFVLGPRGVAALALPSGVAVPIAAAQRRPGRQTSAANSSPALRYRPLGAWHQ